MQVSVISSSDRRTPAQIHPCCCIWRHAGVALSYRVHEVWDLDWAARARDRVVGICLCACDSSRVVQFPFSDDEAKMCAASIPWIAELEVSLNGFEPLAGMQSFNNREWFTSILDHTVLDFQVCWQGDDGAASLRLHTKPTA